MGFVVHSESEIRQTKERTDVQVRLPNGRILTGPRGTTIENFVRQASVDGDPPAVAALLNGELSELSVTLLKDADLQLVTMGTADGMRIYRRSLSLLLITAARELYPDTQVFIDHSVSNGGYFCHVENNSQFGDKELKILKARMEEIVAENDRIVRDEIPIQDAIRLFANNGDQDKVRLLKYSAKRTLVIYSLRETQDYFHGYMVPRTNYLSYFDLKMAGDGFILCYPRRHAPTTVEEPTGA